MPYIVLQVACTKMYRGILQHREFRDDKTEAEQFQKALQEDAQI